MKKLLALLLAVLMLAAGANALADAGSEPDWTEYNALIAQIKAETDFALREELMHKAEDILMGTGALVPIFYYNDLYMKKDGIEGFYANLYGTKFFMHTTFGDKDTLRIQLASEPDRLDPALNSSVDGACLAANSFGGLYTYDANGQLAPNFAQSYETSEDGLTWTFTLKEGLKWSNGDPLTAKDFVYSWNRAVNPDTAADYAYMLGGIATNDDGTLKVSASEDGLKLTVELAAPCAYFLDLAAFPTFYPVHQATVEAAPGFKDADGKVLDAGAWATDAGFVSCGAYVLQEWKHNESMVYVKNPNYFDAENVTMDRLEFMLSADDAVIYAAYNAGNLDFIDTVPTDAIQTLLAEQNPEFNVVDQLGTYYMIFNVKSPLFAGLNVEQAANVRKAIGLLLDRQYIVDTVAQAGQQLASSFIPAGMLDGNGGVFKVNDEKYTYPVPEAEGYYGLEPDVEGAIALLETAGYKFENGMLSAETPLSFEYLTNPSTGHEGIAQCMQQDLAAVGIEMTIKTSEWDVFLNERKDGHYDVARNGWIADFNDPINMLEMWTTESGNNDAQFGR
mgnify:CR=1 FL=1